MRVRAIVALAMIAFLVGGCDYLYALGGGGMGVFPEESFDPGDFGSFDPGAFPQPSPSLVFTEGSATLTIDGQATTLDQLVGVAGDYDEFGTEVAWTDGQGLYVRYIGSSFAGLGQDEGFMTIDRIREGQHWTSEDSWRCDVAMTRDDESGIDGTASCPGLHWLDAMGGAGGFPAPLDGQQAFDAEIAFEARP